MGFLETYNDSHKHPFNRWMHNIGIPMLVISFAMLLVDPRWALGLFVLGWVLQFIGHAVEGKKPLFLVNPVYMLVALYWWCMKIFKRKGA